jgi:hypothetical protein
VGRGGEDKRVKKKAREGRAREGRAREGRARERREACRPTENDVEIVILFLHVS